MKDINNALGISHVSKTIFTLAIAVFAFNYHVSAQSLALDTGFTAGVNESRVLNYVSVQQPDGKVLVGGSFSFANGVSKQGFTRLNADGTLDSSFNPGGTGTGGGVLDIIVLGDGKILIAGDFASYNGTAIAKLARLNADGTLDTTFNSGGSGGQGNRLTSISLQTDGKIIAAGQSMTGYNGNTSNGIFRVNTDGSFDSSFVSGFAASPGNIEQAIVQADDKILIGGFFSNYGGVTVDSFIRVNSDGTLDTNFSLGSGGTNGIAGIGLQPDGKILIGGDFSSYNGTPRNKIARLNADGTLDKGFVPPPSFVISYVEYFAVRADGKILVALTTDELPGGNRPVIRLNTDGTEDTAFDAVGDGIGYHVSLQTDGKILSAGNFSRFTTGEERGGIVRYNTDGTIDSSFSASLTGLGLIDKMARQPDGKIVVVGQFGTANGVTNSSIARFNSDGTLDSTFDSGTGIGPGTYGNLSVEALELQPDGKILVGGFVGSYDGVVKKSILRVNSDGSLDTSFTFSGDFNLDLAPFIKDFYVQSDGKIVVAGRMFRSSFSQVRGVFRLNADGSEDPTFNGDAATTNSIVNGMVPQTDGKIIIGGGFTTYSGVSRPRLARLNADGTLDTSFDPGTGPNGQVFEPVMQSDGKVIIGGSYTTYNGSPVGSVARLNADGTLDTTFNVATNAGSRINSIITQTDGTILIGGDFTSINGTAINDLARLNPDGSLDTEVTSGFGAVGSVEWMLREPDGKLILGGRFDNYDGTPKENIVRLVEAFSGADQPILFITNRDGNNEIYRMSEDGTNQERLTDSPDNDFGALWSPDGSKILYATQIDSNTTQIWVMNPDGSNKILLSDATGVQSQQRWSPDGSKILFARTDTNAFSQLWTMNADGSNKQQLTNVLFRNSGMRWSPDGSKITFGRCDASNICDVYTIDANGTNETNLTSANPNDDDVPLWTPVGNKIVYLSTPNGSDYNAYIMDADGTNKQPLTNSTSPEFHFPQGISPDGSLIAMNYQTTVSGANGREISTVGIDGSNLTNVTNNSSWDIFSAFSPDGSKIAFRQRIGTPFKIFIMNADGSDQVQITLGDFSEAVTDWRAPLAPPAIKFDFDGDGRADTSVFRPGEGNWYLNNSTTGFSAVYFGLAADKLVPADYDGDGKTDIAVWRESQTRFYILQSTDGTVREENFGLAGDVPNVVGDWDGDGLADPAVYRAGAQSTFYYRGSNNNPNGNISSVQWGITGDKPVNGDFDGDGKLDAAVFRPSNGLWYIHQSSDSQVMTVSFGLANDKPVAADYDGDGKTDIAVYRPSNGTWYFSLTTNGFTAFPFGISTDLPVPADYDGDGKADAAVYRDGTWYILGSTSGTQFINFGLAADKPIPASMIP